MLDVATVLQQHKSSPPNILATLQKIQEAIGYVPRGKIPEIAAALGVTDSDVAGVLSFYHDLRTHPPGRHILRFCLGDSCLATHCEKSLAVLEEKLGCKLSGVSRDKRFTLEKVYCLGNCALSPSLMIDDKVHGRFTPKNVATILRDYR